MATTAQHIRPERTRPVARRLHPDKLELTQLGSGSTSAQNTLVALGNVWIAAVHTALPLVVRGRAPSAHVTLLLVDLPSPAARVGLRFVGPGRCAVLACGADVNLFLPAECSLYAVSIADRSTTEPLFDEVALGGSQQTVVLVPAADRLAWLLRWGRWIATRSVDDPVSLQAPGLKARLQRAMLSASRRLVESASVLDHDEDSVPLRQRAVMRARELVRERIAEPLSLVDLCDIAHVGARTLEYGFRELYGMSPIAYIRCERLCRVHDELLAADGAPMSVSRTASRWGFAHMSQFAKDYRTLFGESPSGTLLAQKRAGAVRATAPRL